MGPSSLGPIRSWGRSVAQKISRARDAVAGIPFLTYSCVVSNSPYLKKKRGRSMSRSWGHKPLATGGRRQHDSDEGRCFLTWRCVRISASPPLEFTRSTGYFQS